jgi:hypothetical protein
MLTYFKAIRHLAESNHIQLLILECFALYKERLYPRSLR